MELIDLLKKYETHDEKQILKYIREMINYIIIEKQNNSNFSEEEKCLGKCTNVVPQGIKNQGSRYVSRTMNHQGKLKCVLVNGRRKDLWSKQVSRMNLTHMYVMLILRTSCQITVDSTTTSLIPL